MFLKVYNVQFTKLYLHISRRMTTCFARRLIKYSMFLWSFLMSLKVAIYVQRLRCQEWAKMKYCDGV